MGPGPHRFGGPHGKWLVLVAVGTGSFMSALDVSVSNVILPLVASALDSDVATVEWVVTIYLLVVSGLLLSFGRLGDLRGHKRVYVSGFGVFVLGSALCGLAPTAAVLVAMRALQALGAAMLFATSPALVTASFPAAQRGQALGLQATLTYLGLSVGPALGGWLADQLSWRAVFFVNVPIGLLALSLSLRFIPRDRVVQRPQRFDVAGALTFMAGLVALLLGLNQGHAWGWTSPAILGSLVVGVLLLGCFLVLERRVAAPMLDLNLFKNRLFSAAALSAVLNYISVSCILFLLPFYLVQGRQIGPDQAGLVLTAQPLVMTIVAPLSGTLSDRIGSRLPATLGMGLLALALVVLSRLGPDTSLAYVVGGLALAGMGAGLFTSPNNSALMGAAPPQRQGIAAGVLATARNVGMALGVGLSGAVFTTVLAQGQAEGATGALFDAVAASFLAATPFAIVGVLASAIRQRSQA